MITTRQEVAPRLRHPAFAVLCLRPPIVQLTAAEQQLLCRQAALRQHAVELGVAEGGSAYLMAQVLAPNATLDLVDPFFPGVLRFVGAHELIARRLMGKTSQKVRFIKALSWEAPRLADFDPVDLLFIDADHSTEAVRRDWNAWEPLLSSEPIVLFHDAVDERTGVLLTSGPGIVVRELVANGWVVSETAGALAAIARK
jgi:predicted O-methyltransferase YrrM